MALGARVAALKRGKGASPSASRTGLEKLRKQISVSLRGRGAVPSHAPKLGEAKQVAERYYKLSADADGAIRLDMDIVVGLMNLEKEFGSAEGREVDSAFAASDRVFSRLDDASDAGMLADVSEEVKALLRTKFLPGWWDDLLVPLAERLEGRIKSLGGSGPSSTQ